ncbi:MAG: Rpn family recombination-promoting nuclease/putative transposase [Chloroflexota bacterium]|nr:Rpn family recombination-promoting nuclease/putative transposase [Chloroflexota bacterium]
MTQLLNPHDAFFKQVFSRREAAHSFLAHYLPAETVSQFDLDTLTIAKDTFVDDDLRSHYSDILYQAALRDGSGVGYVAVLFEHKSYADRWVALQLLRYMVRIWEERRKQGAGLPPIVPVVVYHGAIGWNVPLDFGSLVEGAREGLAQYLPDYRYWLCDLSTYSDEEIVGAAYLQMALLLLKYALGGELWDRLPGILRLSQELWQVERPTALAYFETILRYVSSVAGKKSDAELREVVEEAFPAGGEMMETILERWAERGFQRGVQQGLEQGAQRGIREGLLEAIELGLNLRFGVTGLRMLPQVYKIEDGDRLRAIKQALLRVESMDELSVLLEPPGKQADAPAQ